MESVKFAMSLVYATYVRVVYSEASIYVKKTQVELEFIRGYAAPNLHGYEWSCWMPFGRKGHLDEIKKKK